MSWTTFIVLGGIADQGATLIGVYNGMSEAVAAADGSVTMRNHDNAAVFRTNIGDTLDDALRDDALIYRRDGDTITVDRRPQ
jgi:hypothetical protein